MLTIFFSLSLLLHRLKVAMDMQARIFTWGFGGYGRLGHGDPRDEPVPRALKFFEPSFSGRVAGKIRTGSSYSMVVATNGELYSISGGLEC